MNMNQSTLMDTGMRCLIDTLGPVEAERFIANLLREPFDYTEWRKKNLCPGMSAETIHQLAKENWDRQSHS